MPAILSMAFEDSLHFDVGFCAIDFLDIERDEEIASVDIRWFY